MAEQPPEVKKIDDFEIIGSTGLRQSGGWLHEEFLPKLQGQRGVKTYREMSDNCAVVGAINYLIQNLARQVPWRMEPFDESVQAVEQAEFIDSVREDMDHSWADFMSEALSAIIYGWSFFEIVLKTRGGESADPRRNSKFSDNKIGVRRIALRPQDTLWKWEFNEDGDTVGLWQTDFFGGALAKAGPNFIPSEKALHFRTQSYKNNPEGRSLLRNSVRSWFYLKRLQESEAIGIERDLAGYPVIEVPPEIMQKSATPGQKAIREELERLVQQIRRDEREGAVIPSEVRSDGSPTGFKLRLLNSGGKRQVDTDTIIRRYESRITMSVLAQFLMLGETEVGAYSLASSQTHVFSMALGAVLDSIASTINSTLVEKLIKINGMNTELMPSLVHGDIEAPPLEEIGNYIKQLTTAGIAVNDLPTERKLREYASLPEPPEEDDFRDEEEELPPAATMVPQPEQPEQEQDLERIEDDGE